MKYYRICKTTSPEVENNFYNRLNDNVEKNILFATDKNHYKQWASLIKTENNIDKVFLFSFELEDTPKILTFEFRHISYTEFTFCPQNINFKFEGIL